MNTTRQRQLVVIGCIGIGVAGYAGYLVGHNNPPSLPAPISNSVPALTTLLPQQPQRSMQKVQRTMAWQTVRPDLFTPSLSTSDPLPLSLFPSGTLSASHETRPLASLLPAPSVVDPLADYIYNGTVNMGGTLSALIEHRASKQGWYVQAGDPWQNYRIVDVTVQAVTVQVEGKTHILPKSNVINLVPLLADADSGSSLGEKGLSQIAQADTQKQDAFTDADLPLSLEEIAHIKNEVFEGRMSAAEAERVFKEKGTELHSFSIVVQEADGSLSLHVGRSNKQPAEVAPAEPAKQPVEPSQVPSGEQHMRVFPAKRRMLCGCPQEAQSLAALLIA